VTQDAVPSRAKVTTACILKKPQIFNHQVHSRRFKCSMRIAVWFAVSSLSAKGKIWPWTTGRYQRKIGMLCVVSTHPFHFISQACSVNKICLKTLSIVTHTKLPAKILELLEDLWIQIKQFPDVLKSGSSKGLKRCSWRTVVARKIKPILQTPLPKGTIASRVITLKKYTRSCRGI